MPREIEISILKDQIKAAELMIQSTDDLIEAVLLSDKIKIWQEEIYDLEDEFY